MLTETDVHTATLACVSQKRAPVHPGSGSVYLIKTAVRQHEKQGQQKAVIVLSYTFADPEKEKGENGDKEMV